MAAPTTGTPERPVELLERTEHLAMLAQTLAAVRSHGSGRLVFVGGEAGVGKTVLLRRFCDDHEQPARVLWGACDSLFTPRPLGPLVDIAQAAGADLVDLVRSGRPHEVAGALIREFAGSAPTVLVLDDLQWADEATLDVLTLVGRRISAVPALVLAAYRDELDRTHPFRIVLGELATGRYVSRLAVEPLSQAAVAALAEPSRVDAGELFEKTGGNPFFVTEVLAAAEKEIPPTVRDTVLGRVARLSPEARSVLESVAVMPQLAELWLLEALVGGDLDRLEEGLSSGMLTAAETAVGFRHELARLAVEESLAPDRALSLHRRALEALAAPPAGAPDPARLAHHAEAARDESAVLRFAPQAAREASAVGAHREAAAQYARALRFSGSAADELVAGLLGRQAFEYFLTGNFDEAIAAQERALDLHRSLHDPRAEGDALRSLSRLLRFVGRTADATEKGLEAVALLEQLPPGHELALAYANVSHIYVTADDHERTIAWGARALELAERIGDTEAHIYALLNTGAAEFILGDTRGVEKLEESVRLASEAGFDELAGRAHLNLVWWPLRQRAYDIAETHLGPALGYCTERGLDLWRLFLLACRTRLDLDRARWDDAGESASSILRDVRLWPVPRLYTLAVLGLVRARRGDPEVWAALDEAWDSAEPTGELQRIGPVATARAEAVWLDGRPESVRAETDVALELAVRRRSAWVAGELACWRRRAGLRERVSVEVAEPYALELAGEHEAASERWTRLGCPYEAALVLAESSDSEALRRSLEELQRLDARPAAAIVARRLRDRGARGLPRGPRPVTRANPAGLTARELDVLRLLAEGLRNAEIAERLVVSRKTIDHHVSAILRKLEVRTRGQAAAEAARLGLLAGS